MIKATFPCMIKYVALTPEKKGFSLSPEPPSEALSRPPSGLESGPFKKGQSILRLNRIGQN